MRLRLFVAILLFSVASVSHAFVSSKTANHILYKTTAGTSTIPIPDWELIIYGDSLAGKKDLPVPKSDKKFNVRLPFPRDKLLPSLARFARLSPYVFIAYGLIDLYFDETKQQFMIGGTISVPGAFAEFEDLLHQRYPDAVIVAIRALQQVNFVSKSLIFVDYYLPDNPNSIRTARLDLIGRRNSINEPYERFVQVDFSFEIPYGTPVFNESDIIFESLRDVDMFSLPLESGYRYIFDGRSGQTEPRPATETEIAQNLDKNLTEVRLASLPDLITSQNWTLETDTIPVVTGPSEVVVSTQTKTIQNADGTTTTQTIVEKIVYTYVDNVIIETHVTQVFDGTNLVEETVTGPGSETGAPVDYSFEQPDGEYDTELEIPEKRDLIAEVLDPVVSQLTDLGSRIGLRGAGGQCSFDIPVTLGGVSRTGHLNFCQYQSTFSTIGDMLVALAYLLAGLIVLGMRH